VEEVDAADEVELVDAGAADELDDEETEAELDVVGLTTTAVAAPAQWGISILLWTCQMEWKDEEVKTPN
jgi:hypothetical protein